MDRAGNFAVRFIKGVIIGVAGILPGASGGVLAVSMGVYKPVLDAVTGLFRAFGRNAAFLLPLGLGGAAGLLGAGRAVEWLMLHHARSVMWALIGMVLGGVPSLIKEANAHGFRARYLSGVPVGAGIVCAVALAQALLSDGQVMPLNGWTSALCGGLIGLGTVVPGVSTSFIMMHLGLYGPFLAAFNDFDMGTLCCAAAGGLALIAALVLTVKKLFDVYHAYACYASLGLLLASILLIFPGFAAGWGVLLDAALFAACSIVTAVLCARPGAGGPDSDSDGAG